MMLTKGCIHGIRAGLYLALPNNQNGYIAIKRIADDLNISSHFLTKIIHTLAQHDLMNSFRGPNGGAALARPANEISLMDIVDVLDGRDTFKQCFLGLPGCGELQPCPMHDQWMETRQQMFDYLTNTSLEELAAKADDMGLRLMDANSG